MITELSQDRFPRTFEVLQGGVKEGVAPGFVVGLWEDRHPDRFLITAFGKRRLEPSALPMLPDTVFDIASVSKIFATATLAGVMVERGWISWETRVASVLPGFAWPEIEFQHLLSHTAGFHWWEPFYEMIRDRFAPRPLWEVPIGERQKAMKELILAAKPKSPPGEAAEYSDISCLLAGFVLEEITKMPLDQAVRHFVWKPMGIRGAHYRRTTRSPARMDEEVAATELSPFSSDHSSGSGSRRKLLVDGRIFRARGSVCASGGSSDFFARAF